MTCGRRFAAPELFALDRFDAAVAATSTGAKTPVLLLACGRAHWVV
jgi:hypothetical protein